MLISLLGPLELHLSDAPVPVTGGRRRALLGLLALHAGQPVGVDDLVAGLWGAEPPAGARASLRATAAELRGVLAGAGELLRGATSYVLHLPPGGAVDVHLSRSLSRDGRAALVAGDLRTADRLLGAARALWRGPALCDVVPPGADWPELAEVAEEHLTLLEDCLEVDLALGRHERAVAELCGLVQREPWRERLHAMLMRGMAAAGSPRGAEAAYERIRATLADEWGVDPGRELRELRRALAGARAPAVSCADAVATGAGPVPASAVLFRFSGLWAGGVDAEQSARLLDDALALADAHLTPCADRTVPVLGSGLVAIFGREDHAERAVRAAVATCDAVTAARGTLPGPRVRVSAAVATGEVDDPVDQRLGVVLTGGVLDTCRRLVASAPAGRVLVAEATARATAPAVAYRAAAGVPAAWEPLRACAPADPGAPADPDAAPGPAVVPRHRSPAGVAQVPAARAGAWSTQTRVLSTERGVTHGR